MFLIIDKCIIPATSALRRRQASRELSDRKPEPVAAQEMRAMSARRDSLDITLKIAALLLTLALLGPGTACAQSCPAHIAVGNTSGSVSVSANASKSFVPLVPSQFTTPTCAQNWVLVAYCTVQFTNGTTVAATVTPSSVNIRGVNVPASSSQYITWTYSLSAQAGSQVSGSFCPISSTESGTATGSLTLIELPQ
jgi:hypothetical protein